MKGDYPCIGSMHRILLEMGQETKQLSEAHVAMKACKALPKRQEIRRVLKENNSAENNSFLH
jgi:hypothetical protein